MVENKKLNFGISSWTFPWSVGTINGPQPESRLTVIDLLNKAIELEVELIQIADNLPLESVPHSELVELRAAATEYGISIEVGTKGTDPHHLRNFLEIAKTLGSPIVRTLPGSFIKKTDIEEVEINLRDVLPDFEKADVKLVLENTEAYTGLEYLELMQRINHQNIRMCIDLANALGRMEGPLYFMDLLASYCGSFHFKDVDIIRSPNLMGFSVTGKPAGQGSIPVKWAMSKLKSFGLFPSVIIELWPPLLDTIEGTIEMENKWAKQSVDYLKSLN
jgi:3-oxoisoapionate decarboxylase